LDFITKSEYLRIFRRLLGETDHFHYGSKNVMVFLEDEKIDVFDEDSLPYLVNSKSESFQFGFGNGSCVQVRPSYLIEEDINKRLSQAILTPSQASRYSERQRMLRDANAISSTPEPGQQI
jgi:hypothetical protein